MRKYIQAILIAGIFIASACHKEEAGRDVPDVPEVDDVCTKMDDIVFMKYCYDNFDVNHDGKVSQSEAEGVTKIDMNCKYKEALPYQELRSLKGVEYFKNLKDLDCTKTTLESVDVARNTQLEILALGGTNITSLDVSTCQSLKELYAWETSLASLAVSSPALVCLDIDDSPLSKLDISKCSNLDAL